MVEEIESVRDAETGVWAETVVAEYLPGLELDEHIVAFLHGEEIHFHQDHLGSVLMLTDADGEVLQRYRYDIHGNATVLDPAGNELGAPSLPFQSEISDHKSEILPLSPYLFTGRRLDRETGLYYYRNRYYSPLLGKFISPDPLDYVDGMNVYAYVNGNVVNLVDPMGLAAYFFDGTGNQPFYYKWDGSERNYKTNIRKLYEAIEGDAFYVPGIGSGFNADGKATGDSSRIRREGMTGDSMKERTEYMLDRLHEQVTKKGDKVIDLFGFSRGAATSTYFLNRVQERIDSADPKYKDYKGVHVRFAALFDQVSSKLDVGPTLRAAFGNGVLAWSTWGYMGSNVYEGPLSEKSGEFNFTLPRGMRFVNRPFHIVSLDEQRREFAVTDLEGAYQIGFRGVHSDVGGGYDDNFFEYITRQFVYEEATKRGLRFNNGVYESFNPKWMRDLYEFHWSMQGAIADPKKDAWLFDMVFGAIDIKPTDNSELMWDDGEKRKLPKVMVLHKSVAWFSSAPKNSTERYRYRP